MNRLTTSAEKNTSAISDRVVAELMYRMSLIFKMVLTTTFLPVGLVVIFWGYVNHTYLLIWALVDITLTVDRYWISRRYLKSRPPEAQARRWAWRYTISALASGITLGVAGMLFFVDGSLPHQVLLIAILLGVGGGSITIFNMSYWPPIMYVWAIPAFCMTATRVAMEGSLPYQVLSGFLLFYLVMLNLMVKRAHEINVEAINLRFENLDLIEQLKVQKEIAEQANVAKSKFLAAASHDLRQPLHALGLFASALDERIKFPEVRVLVENINRSVAALEELFNALLDISRLDAGIIQPDLQHFRLKELAEKLNAEFAAQAQHKGLNFQIDGPDVTVYCDPTLLDTMLQNLISNGMRFTNKGEVKVVWHVDGSKVVIEIHDTGIGIPEEDRELIFQEFLQLNNPERDRTKGLGLGLAIVRRLAGLLQCTITVQSTVGNGSIFRLAIPLGDTALITDDRASLVQQLENEPAMLVLVIDDELAVRESMTALLGNWGHEVVAVGSLTEAMQVIKRAPDAIIADYRLRESHTGIEAIQHIHEVWGSDIPSLIVTGDTAPERLREAQDSGFAFMHKPVNAAKMRAFLRSAGRQSSLPS
jgi:signal transduction histidine kinase/CheY-like chemotaxis protein